jgi:hypothetical protein
MAATENRQNDPLGGCKHRQLGKVIGISSRARQRRQHIRIAMVDTETGEFTEKRLGRAGDAVRGFYAALEGPVVVGIEATGAMQWDQRSEGLHRDVRGQLQTVVLRAVKIIAVGIERGCGVLRSRPNHFLRHRGGYSGG